MDIIQHNPQKQDDGIMGTALAMADALTKHAFIPVLEAEDARWHGRPHFRLYNPERGKPTQAQLIIETNKGDGYAIAMTPHQLDQLIVGAMIARQEMGA